MRIGDNVWIAPNVGIYAAGHPLDVGDRIAGWEYAFPVTIGNIIGGGIFIGLWNWYLNVRAAGKKAPD